MKTNLEPIRAKLKAHGIEPEFVATGYQGIVVHLDTKRNAEAAVQALKGIGETFALGEVLGGTRFWRITFRLRNNPLTPT